MVELQQLVGPVIVLGLTILMSLWVLQVALALLSTTLVAVLVGVLVVVVPIGVVALVLFDDGSVVSRFVGSDSVALGDHD